jgi:hypothetical protein
VCETTAARCKAWTVFASSNTGIVGSNPIKAWMSVCVYSVFVLSCVGSGLPTGWSPVHGILPTVLGLRNWSETKRFTDVLCSKVEATGERERERWVKTNYEPLHYAVTSRYVMSQYSTMIYANISALYCCMIQNHKHKENLSKYQTLQYPEKNITDVWNETHPHRYYDHLHRCSLSLLCDDIAVFHRNKLVEAWSWSLTST